MSADREEPQRIQRINVRLSSIGLDIIHLHVSYAYESNISSFSGGLGRILAATSPTVGQYFSLMEVNISIRPVGCFITLLIFRACLDPYLHIYFHTWPCQVFPDCLVCYKRSWGIKHFMMSNQDPFPETSWDKIIYLRSGSRFTLLV